VGGCTHPLGLQAVLLVLDGSACEGVNLRLPSEIAAISRVFRRFRAVRSMPPSGLRTPHSLTVKTHHPFAAQLLHYLAISNHTLDSSFLSRNRRVFWQYCVLAAGMAMPKTPVHKMPDFPVRQYNVRFSVGPCDEVGSGNHVHAEIATTASSGLRCLSLIPDIIRDLDAVNYIHLYFLKIAWFHESYLSHSGCGSLLAPEGLGEGFPHHSGH
jgi:hypothetical protein